MQTIWYSHLVWVVMAGVLGFTVAAVFSRWLHMLRRSFLLPYIALTGAFSLLYFQWRQVNLLDLFLNNWLWGVIGAFLLGVFVVRNILSQPASSHARGWRLVLDFIWLGGVYGLMDAVLLSVIPVLATWEALSQLGWTTLWYGKLVTGVVCLVASLLVTGAYHLGYTEYRGRKLIAPLIGNGTMSLGYLITANPIAAIGSHIAMHMAGVLHGPETTAQLPPHYSEPPLRQRPAI